MIQMIHTFVYKCICKTYNDTTSIHECTHTHTHIYIYYIYVYICKCIHTIMNTILLIAIVIILLMIIYTFISANPGYMHLRHMVCDTCLQDVEASPPPKILMPDVGLFDWGCRMLRRQCLTCVS